MDLKNVLEGVNRRLLVKCYWWLANQLIGTLPPPAGLECGTEVWREKKKK